MIRCDDWRRSSSDEIAPLLDAEREAWRRDLDWDVRSAWHAVEPARRAGTLAGFVARDARGRVIGWTSFLLHRDTIQVLALVAPAGVITAALVDAILDSDERAAARTVLFCVRSAAADLSGALAARGFRVEPYRYLVAALEPAAVPSHTCRRWAGDSERLARLLAAAYAGEATTRAFAPNGTPAEWTEYVATLLTTTGCGRFVPPLSLVAPSEGGRELRGAAIVTELSPGTSHVAQIAVDPVARGQGLGRTLLTACMAAAAAADYPRMTLLVGGSNTTALALYASAGFRDRSRFVVAVADRMARLHASPRPSGHTVCA